MIDTKDILKMATHVFKRGQGFYDKRSMHPTREWLIGLFIFMVMICAGGAQSAYTFIRYQNLNTEGGEFRDSMVQFNPSLADEGIKLYTKRKEAYDAIRGMVVNEKPAVVETIENTATSSVPVTTSEPEVATTSTSGGPTLVN
jgi:hypothetical protein